MKYKVGDTVIIKKLNNMDPSVGYPIWGGDYGNHSGIVKRIYEKDNYPYRVKIRDSMCSLQEDEISLQFLNISFNI